MYYFISFLVKQCSYFHHVTFFLVRKNHYAVSTLSFVFSVILTTAELAVIPRWEATRTLKRNTTELQRVMVDKITLNNTIQLHEHLSHLTEYMQMKPSRFKGCRIASAIFFMVQGANHLP
jgi:hypothetical protein